MTELSPLLRLLEAPAPPRLPAHTWTERLGGDLVARLTRGGLLVDAGTATHLPCRRGGDCARRVVPNPLSAAHPLVAVCARDDGEGCDPEPVTPAEAQLLAVSMDGLVRQVRRAFGIGGVVDAADAGFPDVLGVGLLGDCRVLLALQPGLPGFEAWLESLGKALVLVPTGRAACPALVRRHGAGSAVELRALDVALHVDGRHLAVANPPLVVREEIRLAYGDEPSVCELIDQDGRRPLTTRGYAELLAERDAFDLFLDTTATVEGGAHPGSRRLEDGSVEQVALTRHEAAALLELITTGRSLRAGDFKSVTVNAVDKVVERARRKLDVRRGRYEWRAIHTLPGATPEAKRWRFEPSGLRSWAVLTPGIGEPAQFGTRMGKRAR